MDAVTYALCKKYVKDSLIGIGALKGAPCEVKSVVKQDGQSVITLQWEDTTGATHESEVYVNDGITKWVPDRIYAIGDLVVEDNVLYSCIVPNNDHTFDPSHWTSIGGGTAETNYYIVDLLSSIPASFSSTDRKIYYCLEDSNFHLWDGTKWSIISSDVKKVELTQAQYDALTPAEKMNGTLYFVTDAAGGSVVSAELTSPLTASQTLGGISAGTTYANGTTLESIIRQLLTPVLYPSFVDPSATLTAAGDKLLEKGGTYNVSMTVAFDRGSISPAYGTSGYRSGNATGYSINGGTAQASNVFNVVVVEPTLNYTATVDYAAGEQPKDSDGNNYNYPLAAGSVTTDAVTYEFVDAMYANTVSANAMAKMDLISKSAGHREIQFPATTTINPECFDVPATWTLTKIETVNSISGLADDATSQFTVTTVQHNDAGGNPVNYNRYTCNYAANLGPRNVTIYWS